MNTVNLCRLIKSPKGKETWSSCKKSLNSNVPLTLVFANLKGSAEIKHLVYQKKKKRLNNPAQHDACRVSSSLGAATAALVSCRMFWQLLVSCGGLERNLLPSPCFPPHLLTFRCYSPHNLLLVGSLVFVPWSQYQSTGSTTTIDKKRNGMVPSYINPWLRPHRTCSS